MKKDIYILIFSIFILLCNSCKKDEDNLKQSKRGTLIETPTFLSTYDRSILQIALFVFAGSTSENFNINYDVELYKVLYNTIDANGKPTTGSGLLIIPVSIDVAAPLLSYQHGTILKKTSVPSNLQGDFQPGLVFAAEGYVVACPDYIGMGNSPKLHPYLHAKSEATAVIDMLRAIKEYCSDKSIFLNDQLFLAGYSQGGHATMAAHKLIEEEYSNEFTVTASAPMAGPYDLSGSQLNYILREVAYPNPGYLAYLIFGYNKVYNMYNDLGSIFISPYYEKLKPYFTDEPSAPLSAVDDQWPSSMIPTAVLKPEVVNSLKNDVNNPLRVALKDNDLINWAPKAPMILCHCDSDKDVAYENSVVAANSFKSKGSYVELINPQKGGDHSSCAIPAFVKTLVWFNSLKKN